jgi:murein L,D-transpeptidase YafK
MGRTLAAISAIFVLGLVTATGLAQGTVRAGAHSNVDRIHIVKSTHTMELMAGDRVVASYRVALGPGGPGPKRREGDKTTPEGRYHVVSRYPSVYRVFMLLDYPNADDKRRFAALKASGELPKGATIGGAIGIHGAPPQEEWKAVHKDYDWTLGCIAIDDDEIRAMAAQVPDGTIVDIEP